jgi:hypothetical protein
MKASPLHALLLVASGCASSQHVGCNSAEQAAADRAKAKVEADFFAEAFAACAGHELEDCDAFPAIRDKYRPLREAAWRQCR